MIQAHFRWTPKCHHVTHQENCLWCADLQRTFNAQVNQIQAFHRSTPGIMISLQEGLPEHSTEYPFIQEYPENYATADDYEALRVVVKYSSEKTLEQYMTKFELKIRLLEQDLRAKYGISNAELKELAEAHMYSVLHDS